MLLLCKYKIPYIYRKCTIETDRQTDGLRDRQTDKWSKRQREIGRGDRESEVLT